MSNQLFHLISCVGALQGCVLSMVFFKKNRNAGGAYFGFFLFVYSIGLLEPQANEYFPERHPALLLLGSLNFLYGPVLYLFINSNFEIRKNRVFHFLPYVCYSLLIVVGFWWKPPHGLQAVLELAVYEALMLVTVGYTIASLKLVIIQSKSVVDTDAISRLAWLSQLLSFLFIVFLVSFAVSHFVLLGVSGLHQVHRYNQLLMMIGIYWFAYLMLSSPHYFFGVKQGDPDLSIVHDSTAHSISTNTVNKRYERSGLKTEQANKYLQDLLRIMETDKPYLNANLTIHHLAGLLRITKNHLTQIINEQLGRTLLNLLTTTVLKK